jgi:hypothetical protein
MENIKKITLIQREDQAKHRFDYIVFDGFLAKNNIILFELTGVKLSEYGSSQNNMKNLESNAREKLSIENNVVIEIILRELV